MWVAEVERVSASFLLSWPESPGSGRCRFVPCRASAQHRGGGAPSGAHAPCQPSFCRPPTVTPRSCQWLQLDVLKPGPRLSFVLT